MLISRVDNIADKQCIPDEPCINPRYQETNVLTKFHEVFTCFHYIHIEKTAPPPGGHVFHRSGPFSNSSEIQLQPMNNAPPPGGHTNILTMLHKDWASNVTSTVFTGFELCRGIIGTNFLTKFRKDRRRNVASRVFTRQMLTTDARRTTHDAGRTKGDNKSTP
ncbi:hypothetical protein DPMN_011910 [Dreissena polymorpha]|uniref:Uncharacterized protein n=1 Tax=Dreissena polymorpha TaxID=45954 RepID=A0A9D4N4W7_DREPO|nr:hypothetical protein DPMN_011910 [Dreissena polymorpha]